MYRRLIALFQRYVSVHGDQARSVAIGRFGARIGQVEQVRRVGHVVQISGWVQADGLELAWKGGRRSEVPDRPRADVAKRRGTKLETGFDLRLPAELRSLSLWVKRAHHPDLQVPITHPSDPPCKSGRRRMMRLFLCDLVRATPALLRYYIHPDETGRRAIKQALRFTKRRPDHPIDPTWLREPEGVKAVRNQNITIILPVYNAPDLLRNCLQRVASNTDLSWRLIAIDDASTDGSIAPILREFEQAHPDRVRLVRFSQNLGFVGAVNFGLSLAEPYDQPIVLLNTDAMVPKAWASRLVAPLDVANVATSTPMSNDAEILSVPSIGTGYSLRAGEAEVLDAAASRFTLPSDWPETPTGVGFCMAIAPDWLAKAPRFDEVFGRGYGEEVDLCQRFRAMGARNVACPDLFVEHIGGQSFGSDEKRRKIAEAGRIISGRYPRYDADVQSFIRSDVLATPRLALALALAGGRSGPLPVFVGHSLGGGAEQALQAEIRERPAALVLRVGGVVRWGIELYFDGELTNRASTDDINEIKLLLDRAPQLEVIYSCGAGDSDPEQLPELILSLERVGRGDKFAARLHDYFMLSPSYTLVASNGFFETMPTTDSEDPAHRWVTPKGEVVRLTQWRAGWARFLERVTEVHVYSKASADLLEAVYPDLPIVLKPHRVEANVSQVIPRQTDDTIGILGNLNRDKGAHVLRQMAARHPGQSFVVIGHVDSTVMLPRNVTVHGAYHHDDIATWASHYGVVAWLMPSVCPETFSFAAREMLATGLPVVGFDLGGQGEALREAANGRVVSITPVETAAKRLFEAAKASAKVHFEDA